MKKFIIFSRTETNILRLVGFLFIVIVIFLLLSTSSTNYYDSSKSLIDPKATAEDYYAKVDNLGIESNTKGEKWYNLPKAIVLLLFVFFSFGLVLAIKPEKFSIKRLLQSFSSTSILIILIISSGLIYLYSHLLYGFKLPYLSNDYRIFVYLFMGILVLTISIQIKLTKQKPIFLTNSYNSIIFILALIMIVVGFLVDSSSRVYAYNENYAFTDYLGIVLYATEKGNWTHNWTISYSILRIISILAMIMGILFVSMNIGSTKRV